ncbi:hypothetical protein VTG60DRAFT_1802 [Thermothelomyces hinnuleus]
MSHRDFSLSSLSLTHDRERQLVNLFNPKPRTLSARLCQRFFLPRHSSALGLRNTTRASALKFTQQGQTKDWPHSIHPVMLAMTIGLQLYRVTFSSSSTTAVGGLTSTLAASLLGSSPDLDSRWKRQDQSRRKADAPGPLRRLDDGTQQPSESTSNFAFLVLAEISTIPGEHPPPPPSRQTHKIRKKNEY